MTGRLIDPRPVFFFSARTHFRNAGDALINRELLRLLRRHGEVRAAAAGAPAAFLRAIGLSADETRYNSALRAVVGAAAEELRWRILGGRRPIVVLAPGDPSGAMGVGALGRSAVLLGLGACGATTVRLGASITRSTPARLRLDALVSRFMLGVGLRDSGSLAAAKAAGFRNASPFPDFALTLPAPRPRDPSEDSGPLRIGVSVRGNNLDPARIETLIRAIEGIVATAGQGCAVKVLLLAQVEEDLPFLREVGSRLAHLPGEAGSEPLVELDLARLSEIDGGLDLVISNRLHGLLLAAANGAIPFGLLWRRSNAKIATLLDDHGLGDFWADLEETPRPTVDVRRLRERHCAIVQAFEVSGREVEQRLSALVRSATGFESDLLSASAS